MRRFALPAAVTRRRAARRVGRGDRRRRGRARRQLRVRVRAAPTARRAASAVHPAQPRLPDPRPARRPRPGRGVRRRAQRRAPHEGFDVNAACGTAIVAARGGRVVRAGYDPVLYGNVVIVRGEHARRDYWYSHLKHTTRLRVGDRVRTAERIGSVGATGNARTIGCHLHFEIHSRGRPIDPRPRAPRMGRVELRLTTAPSPTSARRRPAAARAGGGTARRRRRTAPGRRPRRRRRRAGARRRTRRARSRRSCARWGPASRRAAARCRRAHRLETPRRALAGGEVAAGDLEGDRVEVVALAVARALGRLAGRHAQLGELAGRLRIEAACIEPLRRLLVVEAGVGPGLRGVGGIAELLGELVEAVDRVSGRSRLSPVRH